MVKKSQSLASDIMERATESLSPNRNMTRAEIAGVALELSALATEVTEFLEPLKEKLRDMARPDVTPENARVTIEGFCPDSFEPLGEVTVTFPAPGFRIQKGADMIYLKERLGDSFSQFFEEVVTWVPVKGMEGLLTEAKNDLLTDAVLGVLERTEPTPRVSFRPVPNILVDLE